MMVQMLGVFAEFERATIIDRVIAGIGVQSGARRVVWRHDAFRLELVYDKPAREVTKRPMRPATPRRSSSLCCPLEESNLPQPVKSRLLYR